MTTTLPPICLWCVHHHGQQSITTCDAFPEGIPEEVMSASADHMEPIPGDSGITFELKPGARFPEVLYPLSDRPWVKERTAPASDPPARSAQAKSKPPSPSAGESSALTELRKREAAVSDERVRQILEEARRRGRQEPGSITVLVPSKKV